MSTSLRKRLLQVRRTGKPTPEQYALALLVEWPDLEKAFVEAGRSFGRLERWIGGDLCDDVLCVLNAWACDKKTSKLAEAQKFFGGRSMDMDVRQLVDTALNRFRKDLPELLANQEGKWVAYRGNKRLGVKSTKPSILRWCISHGFRRQEILVRKIEPDSATVYVNWPSNTPQRRSRISPAVASQR